MKYAQHFRELSAELNWVLIKRQIKLEMLDRTFRNSAEVATQMRNELPNTHNSILIPFQIKLNRIEQKIKYKLTKKIKLQILLRIR